MLVDDAFATIGNLHAYSLSGLAFSLDPAAYAA
jgi:hypothetical protein